MATDLASELRMPGVEDGELAELFLEYYGGAQSTSEGDVVYPRAGPYALKVRTKKIGIAAIEPGPGFSVADLQALKDQIKSRLLESPGPSIQRCVLFCSHPVRGHFRSRSGDLQILPAPASAPQVRVMVADHPFVLEFPIRRSVNSLTTIWRRNRQMLQWSWILNAVLRPEIRCIGPRPRAMWVLCSDAGQEPLTQARVKWVQEFYVIDGFEYDCETFTEPRSQPLAQIDDSEYYGTVFYKQKELVLPRLLPDLLDTVAALSDDDRADFLRAARWLYAANAHWQYHTSSCFIALIAAIESLTPPAVSRGKCQSCNRDLGPGSTRQFRDFVEQHTGKDSGEESTKRQLYGLRSRLVHGSDLLDYDLARCGFPMTTLLLQEERALDELSALARVVVVNWLLKRRAASSCG